MERLIPVEGPFRFDLALRHLGTSPSTIAELIERDGYARAFPHTVPPRPQAGTRYAAEGDVGYPAPGARHGTAVARVRAAPGGLRLVVAGPAAGPTPPEAVWARAEEIARIAFGVDADAAGAAAVAGRDPLIAPLVERYRGLRPLAIPDPFETLVWAILGQQINVAFAARLKRVLIERYGEPVPFDGATLWLFPPPERLVDVTPEELRPLQISRQKALYIAELARAVADGRIDFGLLRARPDEEVIGELTRLKGVGRWTAEYLLLRGFGRPDAIPAGDIGLRAALGRLHGLGRHASEAEVRAMAEAWRPYRGFVAFYLWFALQQREL
ncbi:MAG TPA: DNA-3-methyladenine glycosylase [Chloroflexota bacterium]